MFKYCVITTLDDVRMTLETNDIDIAISEYLYSVRIGDPVDLIDGTTGEVLSYANQFDSDTPYYVANEMILIIANWATKNIV